MGCSGQYCRGYGAFNIWHFKGSDGRTSGPHYFMARSYPHCGGFNFEIMMRIINPGFHHLIIGGNLWEKVGKQSSKWVKLSRTFNSGTGWPDYIWDEYKGGHWGEHYDDDNEFEFMIALPYLSTKCP